MLRIFLIILVFKFLAGCQTMKEGFALQKKQAADEFLVEKKNPLVQPPEFGKLPAPTDPNINEEKTDKNKVKQLLGSNSTSQKTIELEGSSKKIEENILEKIKNK